MTSLSGYFDIDLAMGLNFRGIYNAGDTYEAGDVVVHSGTAYVASGAIAAGVTPPGGLWGRLANQGTAGEDGDYSVWLFARGTSAPRRPNTLDASLAGNRISISSTVWSSTEPTGTDPLYASWVRYSYNTSSWQYGQVTPLHGEVGPRGPQGARGMQGEKGDKGDDGNPGATGQRGPAGPQGNQGIQGNPGPQGDTGATGPRGPQGDTGPRGLPGAQGQRGATGAAGTPGSPGAPGAAGTPGPTGPKGDSQRVVYGRFASGVTPSSPTGLGFNNGRITGTGSGNDGSSWNDDIPQVAGTYVVLWAAQVEINNANNTVHVLDTPYPAQGERGPQGQDGTAAMRGADGHPGGFQTSLFRRFSTGLITTPSGVTYNWDSATYANLGTWTLNVPGGSDPLYRLDIFVPPEGASPTVTVQVRGEPFLASMRGATGPAGGVGPEGPAGGTGPKGDTGDAGPAGPKGDSYREIFIRRATAPPTPTGITVNSTGVFTNLTSGGLTWDDDTPTGTEVIWAQPIQIDWSATPNPTVTTIGTPYRAQGERGATGTQGNPGPAGAAGPAGNFTTLIFQWATSRPTDPSPSGYGSGVIRGISPWLQAPPATGGTGEFLWGAQIEVNTNNNTAIYINTLRLSGPTGAAGGVGPQGGAGPAGAAGMNGLSYINYYHANAADSVGTPNIDYDGSTFSGVTAGWTTTVPTSPAGANIFSAPVRYREGTAGETIVGVILEGTVPGSVTPPPSTASNVRITYGITDTSLTPTGTAQMSSEVPLEVGGTHDFTLNMVTTTAVGQSWYVSVPSGFSITSVSDSLEGDLTSDWILANGRYTYGPLRLSGSVGRYDFTVRRNS